MKDVVRACQNHPSNHKICNMTKITEFRRNKLSKHRRARGFTLVEILIVLALIGIVAGLAMSNLGEIFGG